MAVDAGERVAQGVADRMQAEVALEGLGALRVGEQGEPAIHPGGLQPHQVPHAAGADLRTAA